MKTLIPAPWHMHPEDESIFDDSGETIFWPYEQIESDERTANSRLASAAPDLLAALIRCLEWENSDESWTDVMTAAAAAVAKAGVKQ